MLKFWTGKVALTGKRTFTITYIVENMPLLHGSVRTLSPLVFHAA